MPKYIFESAFDKGTLRSFIEYQDFIDLLKGRGSLVALSEFIKKHFPKLDHDYNRLKLRLWRFKKSGTVKRLEQEKIKEWMKVHPVKRRDHPMMKFKLLQKIADFIYSQPDRKVTQREIQRRFFQKKFAVDIEEILYEMRPWLKSNYGIEYLEGKKGGLRKSQALYVGTMKSSRGKFFKVGVSRFETGLYQKRRKKKGKDQKARRTAIAG